MNASGLVERIAIVSIAIALPSCGGKSFVEIEQVGTADASTLSILATVPIPSASFTDATPCAIWTQCFDHLLAPAGTVPTCHVLAMGAIACSSPMVTPSPDVLARAGLADSVETVCEIPPVKEGASCVAGFTEEGGWCYETREGFCASLGTGASVISFEPLYLSNAVVLIACDLGP